MLTSNPTTQPEELALLQAVKRDELKAMPLIDKAASLGLAGDPAGHRRAGPGGPRATGVMARAAPRWKRA